MTSTWLLYLTGLNNGLHEDLKAFPVMYTLSYTHSFFLCVMPIMN